MTLHVSCEPQPRFMITSTKLTSKSRSRHPVEPIRLTKTSVASEQAVGISIVVPCYNEVDGVENLRAKLMRWAEQRTAKLTWELVAVDDGSTDATSEALKSEFDDLANFQLLQHVENRGLTSALATGFQAARGRWIVCLDADCTYDPILIDQLLAHAETGFDVVTASPYHPQGGVENVAAWRIGISRLASRIYGQLFNGKLSCYTCCVRIYDSSILKSCPPIHSTGFVGVTELLWQLDRKRIKMGEIPATLRSRQTGVSKMRTLRTTLRHLRLLGRIVWCRITRTYDS